MRWNKSFVEHSTTESATLKLHWICAPMLVSDLREKRGEGEVTQKANPVKKQHVFTWSYRYSNPAEDGTQTIEGQKTQI